MVRINRSSVLLNTQDILLLQSGNQAPPIEANNSIQPVVEVGPTFSNIVKRSVNTNTGTSTIYTTPADKDFYMTGFSHSVTKNATSDNTLCLLNVIIGGATLAISALQFQTLTAASDHIEMTFPYPLKIDRNSIIAHNGTFGAGAMSKICVIYGFLVE